MKLRIKQNTLRFRLTQTEVNQLAAREEVAETTHFTLIDSMKIVLRPWHMKVTEVKYENNSIIVFCPEDALEIWASNDEEGIYYSQVNGTVTPLEIAIEKDYACLKPREDESDNFPNPQTSASKC